MAERWFLKVDGIPGESTDVVHKDEIDVLAWSWGLAAPASPGGSGGGGGSGKAEFEDFHFVSRISKASPKLFLAAAAGTHIKSAALTGVRGSAGKGAEYLKYKLSDVLVTSLNQDYSEPDAPTEQFSLGYSKFEISYSPMTAKGTLGPSVVGRWDLKDNKAL